MRNFAKKVLCWAMFFWALVCSIVFWYAIPAYWYVWWRSKKWAYPKGLISTLKAFLFPNEPEKAKKEQKKAA